MPSIENMLPQFFDIDGGPLNSGFIYVGTSGLNPETNPIAVYWDSALTQPAAQPLRTLNGYVARSGSPAQIYTASTDYSITVRNNRSGLVYHLDSVFTLADFQARLAAAIHGAPLNSAPTVSEEIGVWDSVTGLLKKITFTFLQSGVGAVLMTIRSALRLSIWAEHYGADPAASAAVNDAAFAAAITEAVARGGSVVNFGEGAFTATQIVMKTGVHLKGRGSSASRLFQEAGANKAFIITENFAALTGTNAWLLSENVPYGFGLDALTIDGNRANQLAGNGVSIYGKGYLIGDDVKIVNAKEIGFYSECGYKGGQAVEQDMPEGNIGKLQIYMSGKEGFVYRGPHDQPIHDVSVSQAGQDGTYDGVRIEGQLNVFNGLTYVTGSIHAYACTGRGISVCTGLHANLLTGESNVQDGVVLEAAGETAGMIGAFFCDINMIEAYKNDTGGTGTYWNARISGSSNKANVNLTTSAVAAGGLRVNGSLNKVLGTSTGSGAIAHGIGAHIGGANYNIVELVISNFSTAGDVGLKTDVLSYSKVRATLLSCDTGWVNNGASSHNHYDIQGFSAAGTGFTQTGTFAATDTFNVNLSFAGTIGLSQYNDVQRFILVGAAAATITHNGFKTPTAGEISITPDMDWNAGGGPRSMWISNITATTFDINTDVVAPAGGLSFFWKLDI